MLKGNVGIEQVLQIYVKFQLLTIYQTWQLNNNCAISLASINQHRRPVKLGISPRAKAVFKVL